MTSNKSIFCSKNLNSHVPPVHTTNGSQIKLVMLAKFLIQSYQYVMHILFLNSLWIFFPLPSCVNLTFQLHFLLLDVVYISSNRTTLRIVCKIGHLFELINLHIPSKLTSKKVMAFTSSAPSLSFWHSRLGYVSFNRLQTLVSSDQLCLVIKNYDKCLPH